MDEFSSNAVWLKTLKTDISDKFPDEFQDMPIRVNDKPLISQNLFKIKIINETPCTAFVDGGNLLGTTVAKVSNLIIKSSLSFSSISQ